MAAFSGYRVKDRSAKVAKKRDAMPVTGRSVFVIQSVIAAKAAEARRDAEARRIADASIKARRGKH